jgi:hypothetical protein
MSNGNDSDLKVSATYRARSTPALFNGSRNGLDFAIVSFEDSMKLTGLRIRFFGSGLPMSLMFKSVIMRATTGTAGLQFPAGPYSVTTKERLRP